MNKNMLDILSRAVMLLFPSGVTVNKQPSAAAATQDKELHLNYAQANYQEKSTSKRCR